MRHCAVEDIESMVPGPPAHLPIQGPNCTPAPLRTSIRMGSALPRKPADEPTPTALRIELSTKQTVRRVANRADDVKSTRLCCSDLATAIGGAVVPRGWTRKHSRQMATAARSTACRLCLGRQWAVLRWVRSYQHLGFTVAFGY
ncbi:hypothetical protein BDV93DRAFT_353448 [Ceratobasidium sp. AG-I]|nr:hypothetical protein BDV93DRAFT_353448 [Ceratobasidium sp. AG-I]